jgi:nucleoside-diphosphate-sugar epimerase
MIYLVGSEGYIGSLIQNLVPKQKLVRVDKVFRNDRNNENILGSLPTKVPTGSTCILLAAVAGEKECEANRKLAYQTNIELAKKVCDLDFKKIVYTSTVSLYGSSDTYASETGEVKVTSYYTETKYQAEQVILSAKQTNVIARLAIAMGVAPKTNWTHLVNNMVRCAIDGEQISIYGPNSYRPYFNVYDISKGLLLLNEVNDFDGQIINVGNTALNYTKIDIANSLTKLIPNFRYNIYYNKKDKRNYKVSFRKFEKIYADVIDLESTLVGLINYHS